jgi:hypothetical protein
MSQKAEMPTEQPMAIQVVADIFDKMVHARTLRPQSPLGIPMQTQQIASTCNNNSGDADEPTAITREPDLGSIEIPSTLLNAFSRLGESSAAYLVSNSPVKSNEKPPAIDPILLSPAKPRYTDMLTQKPETELEVLLQMALRDAEIKEAVQKGFIRGQQAALVLQELYCARVRRQLATREKKNAPKKHKLFGNGLPKMLTGNEFVRQVIENSDIDKRQAVKKERRRELCKQKAALMEAWRRDEEKRVKENEAVLMAWKVEVAEWEAERDIARTEHRKPRWKKPTRPKVQKQAPKPHIPKSAPMVDAMNSEEEIDTYNVDNSSGDNDE